MSNTSVWTKYSLRSETVFKMYFSITLRNALFSRHGSNSKDFIFPEKRGTVSAIFISHLQMEGESWSTWVGLA